MKVTFDEIYTQCPQCAKMSQFSLTFEGELFILSCEFCGSLTLRPRDLISRLIGKSKLVD